MAALSLTTSRIFNVAVRNSPVAIHQVLFNMRFCSARHICVFSIVLFVMSFMGCSRTVTGGFTDSPDKQFRLFGRVLGAYGRSFIENTKKTVIISIYKNDKTNMLLLKRTYVVIGSDVGWEAYWDINNNVTVVIYDYGLDLQHHGMKKEELPQRIISKIKYISDSKHHTFSEQPE